MRRSAAIVIFFLLALTTYDASAQSYFTSTEVGVSLGGSQYFGDLNHNYGLNTIGPAGGVYARKHLNQYISVKVVANFTQVSYDDKYNKDEYERSRNLNFKSDVWEMAAQAEFNFFRFATGDPYRRFTPFLTGGVGFFYYDPTTVYLGQKYNLKSIGTEGQYAGHSNRKYGNTSTCFPLGVGAKFWLKAGVNLTLEIADRLTTTDYLDDVSTTYVGIDKFPKNSVAAALQDRSVELNPNNPLGRPGKQRGNTSTYDQYLMAMFSVSWHFTTYRCPSFMTTDELIRVK